MSKVWGKTFSDARYPGPLLQRSLLKKRGETRVVVVKPLPVCFATEQSTVKVSICYKECSVMLRNLPECSMFSWMVLKPSALSSLLYPLLCFIDFITDWFEIYLSINWLTPFKVTSHLQRPKKIAFSLIWLNGIKTFYLSEKKNPQKHPSYLEKSNFK